MSESPDFFDLFAEPQLMGLREAIKASGIPLSYPAAIRLRLSGRLRTVKVGGKCMTTPDAVRECVRESSQLPERTAPASRQRRKVLRRSPQARRAIAAYGITRLGACELQDLTAAGRLIAPTSHDVGQSDSCAHGDAVRAEERNDV